jgi:hypothetical protein
MQQLKLILRQIEDGADDWYDSSFNGAFEMYKVIPGGDITFNKESREKDGISTKRS